VITAPPIRRGQVGRPYLFCFSTAPLTSLTQANSEFLSESTKQSFRISIAGRAGWGFLQPLTPTPELALPSLRSPPMPTRLVCHLHNSLGVWCSLGGTILGQLYHLANAQKTRRYRFFHNNT
jgi:hypothetical protein